MFVDRMREKALRFVQGFMDYTTKVAMDPSVNAPLVNAQQRSKLACVTGYYARALNDRLDVSGEDADADTGQG